NDGWKGDKKWANLLQSAIFRNGHHNILVLDEADKMLAPKFSHDENVSHAIQSEGLTMLEGTRVDVKIDSVIHSIDTSKISFVLCGAFSNKARDVAEKSTGSRIGFGAAPRAIQPYARPLGEQDLIDFGVMPEFLGRIQRCIALQPMTVDDYYRMTDSSLGFLAHVGEHYKADIRLTPQKRRELAELADQTGLGVRGMENQIRRLVDDAIFDDCDRRCFEF
ncbi:MAG: AAA domain-containing protein, partial [Oscillospiraceae bacterium]|nr:AAA domain-containing protein [Oscillospiraceae bacterium]